MYNHLNPLVYLVGILPKKERGSAWRQLWCKPHCARTQLVLWADGGLHALRGLATANERYHHSVVAMEGLLR